MTTNNNQSTKNGDALFSEAPARIEPQRAPGSAHEPTKSADGSEVNGRRLKAYRSSVATSTLDKSGLLMEDVRRSSPAPHTNLFLTANQHNETRN